MLTINTNGNVIIRTKGKFHNGVQLYNRHSVHFVVRLDRHPG